MEILILITAGISTTALVIFIIERLHNSPLRLYFEKKRIKKFESLLVDALTTMTNCLKAGLSLIQAIEVVEKELPPPISEEFGLVNREHKMGVTLEESLLHLVDRMKGDDIQLVVTSITIAHELGGNLAEIFERIASTIRDRNKLQSRIETLTAQGRMQGIVVSALPIALGLILFYLAPETVTLLWTTQAGRLLLGTFVFLEISGWMLIRRIVTIDV